MENNRENNREHNREHNREIIMDIIMEHHMGHNMENKWGTRLRRRPPAGQIFQNTTGLGSVGGLRRVRFFKNDITRYD